MPLLIPVHTDDILEVVIRTATDTQLGLNVLYAHIPGTITGTLWLQDCAKSVSAGVAAAYRATMAPDATFIGVSAKIVAPTETIAQSSNQGSGVGTSTGDLCPTQSSPVIKKLTETPGRANRGRLFTCFPAAALIQSDGWLSITGIGLIIDLADAFATTVAFEGEDGAADFNWILPPHIGGPVKPIGGWEASGKVGTQKRRGNYGKPNTTF